MIQKPGFVTTPGTTYDASDWELTSPVTLTSGVVWKGGKFTHTGAAFTSLGKCVGVKVSGIELAPSMKTCLDASMKANGNQWLLTYDGTDDTFLYKNVLVDGVKISGKTTLYDGTWENIKTYHNVSFGVSFSNVTRVYDANSQNTLVFGNSIYKFRADNWTLIGDDNHTASDNGVIYIIGGNAQARNVYRKGKQYGYIMRCFGAKLGSDADQDVKLINSVDAETVCYGTLDFHINPGDLQSTAAIPISGIDGWFINNTSANKIDMNNGYVTNAVVLGQLIDDQGKIFAMHITNALAFGAWISAMSGNSSLIKDNSSGKATKIITGCVDVPPGQPVPAGIVDADYYGLTTAGAQRITTPPVKQRSVVYNNYDGKANKWTYFYDDGSVQ